MCIKKIFSIILTLVLTMGTLSLASAEGLEVMPEIPDGFTPIYTAEDLNNIRNNLSGKYILMNDIDLSEYKNWVPIGTEEAPFAGVLDGRGYNIKGLAFESTIFGYLKNAYISNLGLYDFNISMYISMTHHFGALANIAVDSCFENCYSTGRLFATTGNGQLAIAYNFRPGGLIGLSDNSEFKNCYSKVSFNLEYTVMEIYAAGGIVGEAQQSEFECCYAISEFKETFIGDGNTEGLSIYKGGLVGAKNTESTYKNCFYLNNVDYAVGNLGKNPENTKALSLGEMENQSSYIGFDFENVWKMDNEKGYPILKGLAMPENSPEDNPPAEEPIIYLTEAEIIKVPFSKRIVFGYYPESPEEIEIKLTYSNGDVITDTVRLSDDGNFYVGMEIVLEEKDIMLPMGKLLAYGINEAEYFFGNENVRIAYKYLALPSIIEFFKNLFD